MKLDDITKIDSLVQEGGWVGGLRNLPGVRLKVRGFMNTEYDKRFGDLVMALPEAERTKPEVAERIEKTLMIETVLLGWDGIDEPFNPKNAAKALDVPVFRRAVQQAALAVGEIGRATLEADAKN